MTFDEYVVAFHKTTDTQQGSASRLANAALGINMEAGEISRLILDKEYRGQSISALDLQERLGDLFWYMMYMADTLGIPFEDVLQFNISKQQSKYPGGYSVPVR